MNWESATPEQLFRACADSRDREAWYEFHRRYHRTIAGVVVNLLAARAIVSTEAVEEMIQEVYVHLGNRDGAALKSFREVHPGCEFGFLKVLTLNVVRDRLRRHDVRPPAAVPDAADRPDPDGVSRVERNAMIGSIERVLEAHATERDRTIFWLHYRTGLTTGNIATLGQFDLSAKGVESVVSRLTSLLREKFGVRVRETP